MVDVPQGRTFSTVESARIGVFTSAVGVLPWPAAGGSHCRGRLLQDHQSYRWPAGCRKRLPGCYRGLRCLPYTPAPVLLLQEHQSVAVTGEPWWPSLQGHSPRPGPSSLMCVKSSLRTECACVPVTTLTCDICCSCQNEPFPWRLGMQEAYCMNGATVVNILKLSGSHLTSCPESIYIWYTFLVTFLGNACNATIPMSGLNSKFW